jgi:hypothetical protein
MAISNHERVGKALELLKEGLRPFVEREMKAQHAQLWFEQARASVSESQANLVGAEADPRWDVAAILAVMWNQWQVVFRKTLGQADRTLVSELRDVRNRWAHQNPFSTDHAYRALDSAGRLLTAVSAPQADEVEPHPGPPPAPKRFHGSVTLDPTRVGRDAGRIADEVIAHFAGLMGSPVKVTLEIEAETPAGTPDHVVRTVTENSRTLKFSNHGFEAE